MKKPTLVLDFDGVLHSYTSGWQGADVCADPPVPGAKEFVLTALEIFKVCVVSSRSHEPGGQQAMASWMMQHFGGTAHSTTTELIWWELNGKRVTFPLHKPPAHVTLDDRAIQFEGTWPDVYALARFKPWNKR